MATTGLKDPNPAFLGNGWSFPPEFTQNGRGVAMLSGEDDVRSSLVILFGTVTGERFLTPEYGLNPHELLFEPASTTMKAFLKDRITTAILIQEPRVRVVSLEIDSPDPGAGTAQISLEYEIRATNSRYNLVYPFYRSDSNEVREAAMGRPVLSAPPLMGPPAAPNPSTGRPVRSALPLSLEPREAMDSGPGRPLRSAPSPMGPQAAPDPGTGKLVPG